MVSGFRLKFLAMANTESPWVTVYCTTSSRGRLGMTVDAVYIARGRVLARLKQRVRQMEGTYPDNQNEVADDGVPM